MRRIPLLTILLFGCPQDKATNTDDSGTQGPEETGASDSEPTDSADTCVLERWHRDADADGFGDPDAYTETCGDHPDGYTEDGTDCDDGDASVHPAATETCDGRDEDCDDAVDEGLESSIWYTDADGDGFGDLDAPAMLCGETEGYTADPTDCDDTDATKHPGADPGCDGDHDCDGSDDPEAGFIDASGAFTDLSSLGRGTAERPIEMEANVDGELRLCAGDWYVNLVVTASEFSILGQGDEVTVLNGATGTYVLYLLADGVNLGLRDLTLTNAEIGVYSASTYENDVTLEGVGLRELGSLQTRSNGVWTFGDLNLTDVVITGNSNCDTAYTSNTCHSSAFFVGGDLVATRAEISDNVSAGASYGSTYTSGAAYGTGGEVLGNATLEDVTIRDNQMIIAASGVSVTAQGAGLWVGGDLSATRLEVTGNTVTADLLCGSYGTCVASAGGAGLYVVGAATLLDSVVSDNAIDLYRSECTLTEPECHAEALGGGANVGALSLDGSVVSGNSALYTGADEVSGAAGGGAWVAGVVECLGEAGAGQGFTANTANEGGALYWMGEGTLLSTDCAWGSPTTGDDNDPDDIRGAVERDVDGEGSFTCATGSCSD